MNYSRVIIKSLFFLPLQDFGYYVIASILGIVTSYYQPSFLVAALAILPFAWLAYRLKIKGLCICLLFFISFFLYVQYVLSSYTTTWKEGKTTKENIILTMPEIDGDKVTFLSRSLTGEKTVTIYYAKSERKLNQFNKIKIGQTCKLSGELKKPMHNTNEYGFDYNTYLFRQNIHWLFNLNDFSIEDCSENKSWNPLIFLQNQRIKAVKYIENIYPDSSEGIIQALLFGERNQLDEETILVYQQFGVIHLLAISGLHVGLLSFLFYFIAIRMGITREWANNGLLFILPCYIVIAGAAPSVLRACIMAFIVILSMKLRQRLSAINSICIAAFLLLLFRPFIVFEIGFQLSFIVSLALIFSSSLILQQKHFLKQSLLVTVIAQLSSLPVILFHFHEISLMSVPANMLFVPFISFVILPSAIAITILHILLPHIDVFVLILSFLIEKMNAILLVMKPFSCQLTFGKPPFWLFILEYLSVIFVFLRWEMKHTLRRLLFPFILLICAFFIHYYFYYLYPYGKVTFIDVGQGDSILIELPYRRAVYLIDTGGKFQFEEEEWKKGNVFDVGKDIVLPLLKAKGIRTIDKLILTHGDYDHIGAAQSIGKEIKVKEVLFGGKNDVSPLERQVLASFAKKNIPIYGIGKGDHWGVNQYKFYVLSPTSTITASENDQSIVLYFELGNIRWLLTGDLEREGEKQLLHNYPSLKADVLKAGHHGSNTSSSLPLLQQLQAKAAIISVGRNNRFGHPHPEVLHNYAKNKLYVYRTDLQGSIVFKFTSKGGTIYTHEP